MARVLMLGRLRDVAGWREREIEAPASTYALIELLAADVELGAALRGKGVQVAINKALVRGDHPLAATDEIAFLPPMSGG